MAGTVTAIWWGADNNESLPSVSHSRGAREREWILNSLLVFAFPFYTAVGVKHNSLYNANLAHSEAVSSVR